jgi:soluble cytochrome b562
VRDLPLLRVGLGLTAIIAVIALAVNLGERGGRAGGAGAGGAGAAPARAPAARLTPDVAEHWRDLAPTMALLDSATAIGDPERRRDALKAVEDQLERAEEHAPGAGEPDGTPRREYRRALDDLEKAVDDAGKKSADGDLGAVEQARDRLRRLAGQPQ